MRSSQHIFLAAAPAPLLYHKVTTQQLPPRSCVWNTASEISISERHEGFQHSFVAFLASSATTLTVLMLSAIFSGANCKMQPIAVVGLDCGWFELWYVVAALPALDHTAFCWYCS